MIAKCVFVIVEHHQIIMGAVILYLLRGIGVLSTELVHHAPNDSLREVME